MTWDAVPTGKRGRQPDYSDASIQTCLTMKVLFGMALRQTTGFVESLLRLIGLDWAVPDFSTLSRRQKTLKVNIPYLMRYATHYLPPQPIAQHFSSERPKTALQCLRSVSSRPMTFDFFEGPAGSGKTFNMVAHARQLVENEALGEKQRMLALTFMNGARRRLTASLSAEDSFRRKFDCLTFDSFAQTLTRRRSSKLTAEMRQQAEELGQFHGTCYLACQLLQDEEVRRWVARTYPLVLVDEAQDLDIHRQGIILGLKECCTAVVAADSFQCLSDGQETASFIDQLGRAGTTHTLTQSHRTNKKGLLAAALAVRNAGNILEVLNEETVGKNKRVQWVGEGIELSEVPATANNPGLLAWSLAFQLTRGSDDVAFLTPDSKSPIIRKAIASVVEHPKTWPKGGNFGPFPVSWEGIDSSIEDELTEAIGFPDSASYDEVCALLEQHLARSTVRSVLQRVCRVHRVTGQTEFEKAQLVSFISDAVRINTRLGFKKSAKIKAMSIHGAKNREFDKVIVLWPQSATGSDEHKRRLLYNAMTRAKSHCTIIVLGNGRLNSAPFAPS